ncbi:MAG: hypothetical protein PHN66_03020, partial [Candidatus Shapirobacteria bacterium]|nr:hypothetical protein [Candidatus Shapirobacteria bacterium]
SANYGCMRNGVYTSSTADCSTPIGTVTRTYDASCPKRYGAGGGNDDACPATKPTFTVTTTTTSNSATLSIRDGANIHHVGVNKDGTFLGLMTGTSSVWGYTVSNLSAGTYTFTVNACSVDSSSTNDTCPSGSLTTKTVSVTIGSVVSCTSGEKQCSGNVLQKCNSDGTGWETDTDCGDLGCDAATKACKVVSSTCDDIPTTCSDKDFAAYKAKGDFNCNEVVDIIDFSLWKGWYNADKEQCGSVADFSIWKDAFNKSN